MEGKMTNADKMFETIFYKKEADNVDFIEYDNTITKYFVRFWKRRRTISFSDIEMNIGLLKAINEKCKELGWLDD